MTELARILPAEFTLGLVTGLALCTTNAERQGLRPGAPSEVEDNG